MLFQDKRQSKKKKSHSDETDDVATFFDEQYRGELRHIGRDYFKKVMTEKAPLFKHDLDETITEVSTELKTYVVSQLDDAIARVGSELTKQLDERLAVSDKATSQAQELAEQSLHAVTESLHDKFQQLSQSMEQTIASGQATMITAFEENKSQITATQRTQDEALKSLSEGAEVSRQQTEQLTEAIKKTIANQEALLGDVFKENMSRIIEMKQAQDVAMQSLNDSAKALKEQSDSLSATLQQTVDDQTTIMTNAFQENMARVIEHYLLGALGDQYDMKAQLPSIIAQMEANKQAIVDDMKL